MLTKPPQMKKTNLYRIKFSACYKGAIGAYYIRTRSVHGKGEAEAKDKLSVLFDHIHIISIKQI